MGNCGGSGAKVSQGRTTLRKPSTRRDGSYEAHVLGGHTATQQCARIVAAIAVEMPAGKRPYLRDEPSNNRT